MPGCPPIPALHLPDDNEQSHSGHADERTASSAGGWLELGIAPESFLERKNEENDEETEEEKNHQEKKFSEVAVAIPPKMRKLSWKACLRCMKNHLTSLGRSLGLSQSGPIKFYEHHLDCIFCFSF